MLWGGTVALCQGLSVCIFLFWIIFYCCVVSSVPSSLNSSRPVSESPQDKKRSTSPPLHTLHQSQPWGCFLPFSPWSSSLTSSTPSTSAPPSPTAPSSPPVSGLPSQTRSLNLSSEQRVPSWLQGDFFINLKKHINPDLEIGTFASPTPSGSRSPNVSLNSKDL